MKFQLVASSLALAPMALAGQSFHLRARQSAEAITDQLLFDISLPAFISRRAAKDPPNLDWSSDSCSSSPDNPFGFPFDPACQRHDFGYRNTKAQGRFDAMKPAIDDNFRDDLYYQCSSESAKGACESLADVYYWAVKQFGREAPKIADMDDSVWARKYLEKVAAYEEAVQDAQEKGLLPEQ